MIHPSVNRIWYTVGVKVRISSLLPPSRDADCGALREANLSTWTDRGGVPGIMVAAARISPKSESVQTPVWARIGLAPPREAAKKRDRARYRFNFGLLRIWMERITQRTYTPELWTELNSRKQPSGCITGNPEIPRQGGVISEWPTNRPEPTL